YRRAAAGFPPATCARPCAREAQRRGARGAGDDRPVLFVRPALLRSALILRERACRHVPQIRTLRCARLAGWGRRTGFGAASCFETHRSAVALAESHMQASAAMLLSMRPN